MVIGIPFIVFAKHRSIGDFKCSRCAGVWRLDGKVSIDTRSDIDRNRRSIFTTIDIGSNQFNGVITWRAVSVTDRAGIGFGIKVKIAALS